MGIDNADVVQKQSIKNYCNFRLQPPGDPASMP